MKKLLIALALLAVMLCANAGTDPIVKDTVINKVNYHLYQGSKGGRYIVRTSAKTGKTYKQYFKQLK